MRIFLHLAFAVALFAAGVASESRSSDLLQVTSDGWYSWHIAGTEDLEIHALIESGRPSEFYIPRLHCSRRNVPGSTDLGTIDAADSIAWLRRFIRPRTPATTGAMAAIAVHPGADAVRVLQDVVRSDANWDTRREAVFWLGQSDNDAAFAFLDALLMEDRAR
jgi:hypothetical protein